MSTHRTRLAILLWAATPERPALCATPFVHAMAAAALDCEVEIHFSGGFQNGFAAVAHAHAADLAIFHERQRAHILDDRL